jgi:hypothetical protein
MAPGKVQSAIDVTARIVRIAVEGDPPFDEFRDTLLATFDDTRYRPGFGFLVDRRQAAAPSAEYVRRITDFLRGHQREMAGGRVAVVIASLATYGMGRMAQTIGEDLPALLELFTDLQKAEAWLGNSSEPAGGGPAGLV